MSGANRPKEKKVVRLAPALLRSPASQRFALSADLFESAEEAKKTTDVYFFRWPAKKGDFIEVEE